MRSRVISRGGEPQVKQYEPLEPQRVSGQDVLLLTSLWAEECDARDHANAAMMHNLRVAKLKERLADPALRKNPHRPAALVRLNQEKANCLIQRSLAYEVIERMGKRWDALSVVARYQWDVSGKDVLSDGEAFAYQVAFNLGLSQMEVDDLAPF